MRGGFRPLVNPPTPVRTVDLDGTREARERLHEEIRCRAYIIGLLLSVEPGDDGVRVTAFESYSLPEDQPASVEELFNVATEHAGALA